MPAALNFYCSRPALTGCCNMQVTSDLARATGLAEAAESEARRLNRVLQLTGFSDPVYAEAYVTVHQYDIVMDVTVLNRWAGVIFVSVLLMASKQSAYCTNKAAQQHLHVLSWSCPYLYVWLAAWLPAWLPACAHAAAGPMRRCRA